MVTNVVSSVLRNLGPKGSGIDTDSLKGRQTSIRLEDVGFEYDSDHKVLNGIDLEISEPGLYCIVGPNGVGKSTLVKCMCKIQPVTEGRITINGFDVADMTYKDVAEIMGYVPVIAQDVFSMSVLETIMVGCHDRRAFSSSEQRLKAVYKSMVLMQIEDLSSKRFNELSAGQHQKVSIARGIVQKPRVLILDEPTSSLDVRYQVYVTELLRALAEKEGMIILMISHDLNISAKYAHRIIMMAHPGVIYKVGTPEEVITKENIEKVYGVRCRIITDEECSSPVVLLGQAIFDENGKID